MSAKLNLAKWIDCTEVEGPGKRFSLWTQGCLLRCLGCCNPHLLDIVPKSIIDVTEVIEWIKKAQREYDIEGVTFLGGEPMLQAAGLSVVAQECQAHGLSVVVFTGYTLKHLEVSVMSGVPEMLSSVDILIDGAFISSKVETKRNWVGSTNQQFHYLTDKYQPGLESDPQYSSGFELRLSSDGNGQLNGSPVSGLY